MLTLSDTTYSNHPIGMVDGRNLSPLNCDVIFKFNPKDYIKKPSKNISMVQRLKKILCQ